MRKNCFRYHKVLMTVSPQSPGGRPCTNPAPRAGTEERGMTSYLQGCQPHCSIEPSHRVKLRQKLANLRKAEKHSDTVLKHRPHQVGKVTPALKVRCKTAIVLNSKAHDKHSAKETAQRATQTSSQEALPPTPACHGSYTEKSPPVLV